VKLTERLPFQLVTIRPGSLVNARIQSRSRKEKQEEYASSLLEHPQQLYKEWHEKNAFTIQSSLQRLILQCDQSQKEQQNHFKGEQKETPSQQKFNSVPSILHASDTYFSKKFKSYTYKSTSKTKT
jgi:hypothetical protein